MVDITTYASLLLDSLALPIQLADLISRIRQNVKKKSDAHVRDRYAEGMDVIRKNRNAVSLILQEYYIQNAGSGDNVMLRYVSGNRAVDLPLVSRPEYLPLEGTAGVRMDATYCGKDPHILSGKTDDILDEVVDDIALMAVLGLQLWDAPIYSLCGIDKRADLTLGLSRFVSYRATYGSLPDELALALADFGLDDLRRGAHAHLVKRAKLLGSLDQLFAFDQRLCVGGPATLLAASTSDDDVAILLQRRSMRVSDEPGALTVLPKAFHQPQISPNDEREVRTTIYRECYEELFGGETKPKPDQPKFIEHDWYLDRCEAVRELMQPETAELIPLGLVWDLSRGNYHPLFCLYVKDPEWWTKYRRTIRLNWEVHEDLQPVVKVRGDRALLDDLIREPDWAPESYVAFVEGLRYLHKQGAIKGEIALPSLMPRTIGGS